MITYTTLPAAATAAGRTVIVDSRIAGEVGRLCSEYNVKAYSGKRLEPGSDHNCGAAVDFVGTDADQRRLYSYAQNAGKYAYVEPWASSHTIGALGTTGPHVHISFFRCGSSPGSNKVAPTNNLNFSSIEQVWLMAGGSKALAPTMAAIALAETGGTGNPRAHCLNCAGVQEDSRGLWQINVDPNANPQFSSWNLYDPVTNAKAAVILANGGKGLTNWTTYKNNSFLQYLNGAHGGSASVIAPIKSIPGIITGIPGDITSGIGAIAGAPGDILSGITSPIERGFKYLAMELVYVIVLMAGVTTAIVGLALVGVDIGLETRAGKKLAPVVSRVPKVGKKTASKYNPSKENRKSYMVGVQQGERAKAKKQGYQDAKEGNVVSIQSRRGKTKTVVVPSQKQARNERLQKQAKKMGRKPPF